MPKLTLWYAPGACSLAVHIALRETGLPFDMIKANSNHPKEMMHIPEEFAKINPKKRVPVLDFDDEIITEAPAILLAISNLAPELKLYGSTSLEQARVAEWLNWTACTLHAQAYGAMLRPERFSDDPEVYDRLRKQARVSIEKCFQDIDEKLVGEFAVGNAFTVADAYLFPFWNWGNRGGIAMEELYPNYTAHVTRIRDRASTRAALEAEGLPAKLFGYSENKSRV